MPLISAFLLAGRQQEIAQLQSLAHTCELVRCAGVLVHRLQAERGATNLYLGSHDERFFDLWQSRCQETDTAKDALHALLRAEENALTQSGGGRLCIRIALALEGLDQRLQIRSSTSLKQGAPLSATQSYCRIINRFIDFIFEAVDVTVEPAVAKLLLALFTLIEGKEYAGIERATGSRILASGESPASELSLLADLIEQQEQSFARFEAFCGESILKPWRALQNTLPLAALERMRRVLLSRQAHTDITDQWFQTCSERIDRLHEVERHLADHLESVCRQRIAETRDDLEKHAPLLTEVTLRDTTSGLYPERLGSRLNHALCDLLQEQSQKLHAVNVELANVRTTLDERKLVDRAKGLLMSEKNMSEESAYGLMRQKAMNQNCRIIDVAKAMLAIADLLPRK